MALQVDPLESELPGSKTSALFSMDVNSHSALRGNDIGLSWLAGPLRSSAYYMDDATVAVLCGAHVRFTCAGLTRSEIFSPAVRGASTLATNGADLLALSETCLRPAVVVFTYPELEEHARLEDGAELEYLSVQFAPSSERVAALSGVPDYTIFLWDLASQVMIARLQIGVAQNLQLSFCDLDTPHLAVSSDLGLTVVQLEHFGTEWRLTPRRCELAPVRSHCWTVNGDLYCASHHIIYQVSIDTMEVTELEVDSWPGGIIIRVLLTNRGIFAALDDGRIMLCEPKDQSSGYAARIVANMDRPVQDLQPSPNYNFIAVTCREGQIRLLYAPSLDHRPLEGYEQDAAPALDAALLAPNHEHVASIHAPHGLHVWTSFDGRHEASVELVGRLTCIGCCGTQPLVFVGNDESCLFALDLLLPLQPRLVWSTRITDSPVCGMQMSPSGRVGVALTEDGLTYLFSSLPSAGLRLLAQLDTDGRPVAVDSYSDNDMDGAADIFAFLVTSKAELLSFIRVLVVREGAVAGAVTYGLDTVYAGLALQGDTAYTMALHDRRHCCFQLRPAEQLLEEQVSDLLWRPDARCDSQHQLRRVHLRTISSGTLLSVADDGCLRCRPLNLNDTDSGPLSGRHSRQTHQAVTGGIRALALHPEGRHAVVVGADGTLVHLTMPFGAATNMKRRRSSFFDAGPPEAEFVAKMPSLTSWGMMKQLPSWAEVEEEQAWRQHEAELVARRERIRAGVQELREKVKTMLDANAEMEEMDRLPENEFELDLDEQARLEEASAKRVQEVRDSIIDGNARHMYIRDQIKKQCWDVMEVKGKSLRGLMMELEVANYPLLARPPELLALLDSIQERRQLEVAEQQLRRELLEPPPSAASLHRSSVTLTAAASAAAEAAEAEEASQAALPSAGDDEETESDDDDRPPQQLSLSGSLSHTLGVTNAWLVPQLDVCTRKQRVEQIYMLRDMVYQLKLKFNARFEEVYATKTAEVERIWAWADRLQYIYCELKMEEQPWRPQWSAAEQPDTLLTVADDEVKVERYYTPAEQARMEAVAAEEERRRREREANDFRERALMQMMDGVLEVRWEDTLKQDVPRPEFMDAKAREDWTEEEVKEAADYDQKVVQLEADREKYKKMLEQELKKLLVTVQETVDRFDESLTQLFNLKVRTEHAIDQEELKVDRLLRQVAEEDHRAKREVQLCRQMDETQQRKVALQAANADLRRALEVARAGQEPLIQHDRLLERGFKKEFSDVPANVVDVLYRYFRRRPAVLRRHLEAAGRRGTLLEEGIIEVDHRRHGRHHSRNRQHSRGRSTSRSRSPAGSHLRYDSVAGASDADGSTRRSLAPPSTGYGPSLFSSTLRGGSPYLSHRKTVPGKHEILVAMKSLDDDSQRCPEIEPPVWAHMCQLRTAKALMEFEVLRSSAEVAALVDSIEKRRHAEEAMSQRTQELISELAELREHRLRELHDQEIQLVVKQGQVEVDLGDFSPDFSGAGLIHRSRVELLNKQILGIGEKKLEVMRDALRFRRGIVHQRWEYERCRMTLEDLVQKLKDIDFMKVTRAIQQFLVEGGDTTEKQVARLERRLDILEEESDRKRDEDADCLQYLELLLRVKRHDNNRLALQARELNVDVSERELLYDIRCNHQRKWQARERLNNLRKIRDLMDIAGFQQRYMAMLHGELQRHYSKTYPMLHAV